MTSGGSINQQTETKNEQILLAFNTISFNVLTHGLLFACQGKGVMVCAVDVPKRTLLSPKRSKMFNFLCVRPHATIFGDPVGLLLYSVLLFLGLQAFKGPSKGDAAKDQKSPQQRPSSHGASVPVPQTTGGRKKKDLHLSTEAQKEEAASSVHHCACRYTTEYMPCGSSESSLKKKLY